MLTQKEANYLLSLLKYILETGKYIFPDVGDYNYITLISKDNKYEFIIDINRKNKVKPNKCSYQKRYRNDIILLRLDINGPNHTNPDGKVIKGSHLHIYREGFNISWAYPLPSDLTVEEDKLSDTDYLIEVLLKFLDYCNVVNIDEINIPGRLF